MNQEQREAIRVKVKKLALYAIDVISKGNREVAYDKINTVTLLVDDILHELKTHEEISVVQQEQTNGK